MKFQMATANTSNRVDRAEALRRDGCIQEGLKVVEQTLAETPDHARSLLLKSRLFYEQGDLPQAIEALRRLERTLGGRETRPLVTALERLKDHRGSPRPAAFATESMAKLLTQQGYLLEALEVYRQLFEGAPNPNEIRDEILRLKTLAAKEGSREAAKERVDCELETWQSWLEDHPKGT
jgi:tetratricopeptide (TPR) repeat protein